MAYQPSDHEDEESWPTTPGSKSAALYKDYKRLVASIAEELQKVEVIALAYRYGLPMWYSEVGRKESSYASRVLSFMEGRNMLSPECLGSLSESLMVIGRMDLKIRVDAFESM